MFSRKKISKLNKTFLSYKGKLRKFGVLEDTTYLKYYIKETENIRNKLAKLKDRLRRNNIKIDEVTEGNKEIWEECERSVHSILKKR